MEPYSQSLTLILYGKSTFTVLLNLGDFLALDEQSWLLLHPGGSLNSFYGVWYRRVVLQNTYWKVDTYGKIQTEPFGLNYIFPTILTFVH